MNLRLKMSLVVLDCNGDKRLDVIISRRETKTAYW
jgi:hypothetical protein